MTKPDANGKPGLAPEDVLRRMLSMPSTPHKKPSPAK